MVGDIYRSGTDGKFSANCDLVMSFSDVEEVLSKASDAEDGETIYDFTSSVFESVSKESSAYGRVYVANVVDVTEDGDKYMIRVTRDGFVDGVLVEDATEEMFSIDSSTIILKIDEDGKEVIATLNEDSEEAITALDLKTAAIYDDACNKVAVYEYSSNPTRGRDCKMILIYE